MINHELLDKKLRGKTSKGEEKGTIFNSENGGEKKKKREWTHSGESVASVGDEKTSLSDGAVTDGDTLYKPRSTHLLAVNFKP